APDALRYFEYVQAGVRVNDSLWLLWQLPADRPGLITIHDRMGGIARRLVLTGIEDSVSSSDPLEAPRRRRFAVDLDRRRLYLLDDKTLELLVFPIPKALR